MFPILYVQPKKKNVGVSPPFSPGTLPDTQIHLVTSSGLFQDITGASATTPAAADGDPVGTWRAAGGQNFVAPSLAARPTLRIIDGRKWVVSDGTDDQLTYTAAFEVNVTGYGLWAAVSSNGAITTGFKPIVRTTTASKSWAAYQWNQDSAGGAGLDYFANTSDGALTRVNSNSGSLTDGVVFQVAGGWDQGAGFLRHVFNGTAVAPVAMTSIQPSNAGVISLFKDGGTNFGAYRLGELSIKKTWFTGAELDSLTSYGKSTWGALGPFSTPSDLPKIVLWLDPTFGLYQERTGAAATTPAAAAGDPVGTWRAKTGQNFTAPTDAARPTLRFGASNKPFLLFDGVDDVLTGARVNNTLTGQYLAGRAYLNANGSYPMLLVANTSIYELRTFTTTRQPTALVGNGGASITDPTAMTTDQGYSLISNHNYTSDTAALYRDGVSVASGADTANIGAGTSIGIGARPGLTNFWPGGIADVVLGEATLSAAQIADLNTFLNRTFVPFQTPADITNLSLWLDAADGLFQQRTGVSATTPAVADGDPVGTWRSRDNPPRYLVAPTDAARPTLRIINGKRRVVFDGVDDQLSAAFTQVQPTTLGLRYSEASGLPTPVLKTLVDGMNNDSLEIRVSDSDGLPKSVFDVYSGAFLTRTLPIDTSDTTLLYTANGASSEIRRAGTAFASGNAGLNTNINGIILGNHPVSPRFFNARVGRVAMYSRTLNEAEKRSIEEYLNEFIPTDVTGLSLWLDPTFGLYQERTGASATTPAAAAGDPVGTWRARTGQNLVAPSDAARPTLRFVSGKPTLEFDSVDDGLTWTGDYLASMTQWTYAAGVKNVTGLSTTHRYLMRYRDLAVGNLFTAVLLATTDKLRSIGANGSTFADTADTYGTVDRVISGRQTASQIQALMAGSTAVTAYTGLARTVNLIDIGTPVGGAFGGYVYGLVVYNRDISDTELTNVRTYIRGLQP